MKLERLNWNDLRYFLEVARKGRLLTAAKRLGVNHTTVARRISALEDSLAVKLFEQDETGFHLTASGESLLPLAQQVEDVTDLAQERVQQYSHTHSGKLRIGAPDGFGNSFLAAKIADFMTEHTDLTLELVPIPKIPNLTKREVDLAISLERSQHKNMWCRKITDYQLFLYGSKNFLDRHNIDPDIIDEVKSYTFADYIPDILYTEELSFNQHIADGLEGRFQSSTVQAQQQFIANDGGLGVLPYFMAQQDSRLVRLRIDKFNFIRTYWLLIPYEVRRLASVRGLERMIMEMAATNRAIFMPEKKLTGTISRSKTGLDGRL